MELMSVEVRDAEGILTARLKVAPGEITVGRGQGNIVQVDDPYADATHFRAAPLPDGSGLALRDMGTVNGTVVGGRVIRGEEAAVAFGEAIRVGASTVTFVPQGAAIAEAMVLPVRAEESSVYQRIPFWPVVGLLIAYLAVTFWLADYESTGPWATLGVLVALFVLLMAWAGAWAIGTRMAQGVWRLREHLAFAAVLLLVLIPMSTALNWVGYALDSRSYDLAVNWGLVGVLTWTFLFFGHLDIASRRSRRFKGVVAVGVVTAFTSLAVFVVHTQSAPSQVIQRSLRSIYPVPEALRLTTPLADFVERLSELEQAHVEDIEAKAVGDS